MEEVAVVGVVVDEGVDLIDVELEVVTVEADFTMTVPIMLLW